MAKALKADATRGHYSGATMKIAASGAAIGKGDILVKGETLVVALEDIADGASGEAAIEDVWLLPKLDAAVIAVGEAVDWDVSAGKIDDNAMTPASGDLSNCGIAMEGMGATTDKYIAVKINAKPGIYTA